MRQGRERDRSDAGEFEPRPSAAPGRTRQLCLLGAAVERLARPLSAERSPGPGPPCSLQAGLRQTTPGGDRPRTPGGRDPSPGLVSSGQWLMASQQVQGAEGRGASEEPQGPVV